MKIFVTGYMASGKTTFGKALAEKLNVPFVDLDQYIEAETAKKISDIFSEEGEEGFRKIESTLLRKAVENHPDLVMACGGGTPCFCSNMDYLNSSGITIFLETSVPILISRLQDENSHRPLMAGKTDEEIKEKVLSQMCQRLPHYLAAKLKWQGDDLETSEQIDHNVTRFIESYPSLFR